MDSEQLTQKAVFLDCEATGLDAETERIIEIAIITFAGSPLLSSFCNPGRPVSARISDLTGIQNSDLEAVPSESELIIKADRVLEGVQVIGGYFVHLDREYLRHAYARAGIRDKFSKIEEKPFLCAKTLARKIMPDLPLDFSLSDLCGRLSVPLVSCHRAIDDAGSSAGVIRALMGLAGLKTLEEALALQGPVFESPWELSGMADAERYASRKKWIEFTKSGAP